MIRVVVYLSGKAECQLLETQLRQLLSRRSNEELDCRFYTDPAAGRAAPLAARGDALCGDASHAPAAPESSGAAPLPL